MESTQKRSHKNGKLVNVSDRISSLPDVTLQHILSFLTTKETVSTSVLSKRWTHLWASVPVLDFDIDHFKKCELERRKDVFENFVDTVLLFRHKSNLDRFYLKCDGSGVYCSDTNHIFRWIRYALSCNTKVLDVSIAGVEEPQQPFPYFIFGSQSLENLRLSIEIDGEVGLPKFVNGLRRLDRLQKLHLSHIDFEQGFLEKIIRACPVLEDLYLDSVHLGSVNISSNSIKTLDMVGCYLLGDEVRISIPSLLSLTMSLCMNEVSDGAFILENLQNLLYADVPSVLDAKYLGGLVNAKFIEFTNIMYYYDDVWTDEELMKELSELPTFNNLKKLIIPGNCTRTGIKLFACLLQRSPNLKSYKCFGQRMKIHKK